MPTEPPPGRYKVVERGRQLMVIDTRTGQPATTPIDGDDGSPPGGRSSRAEPRRPAVGLAPRADPVARLIAIILAGGATTDAGHPIVRTKPFYDDKAPRDLILDPLAQKKIGYAVAALLAMVVLALAALLTEPAVLVIGFPLASGAVQGWLRGRVTRWLDEIETAS